MNLALLLSICAALGLGVSDYLAGLYSRHFSILSLLFVAQAAGLLVLIAAIPVFPGASPTAMDMAWGAIAGAAGAAGVLLLVKGFRVGLLSVVSPVSSLGAAGIPLVAGLLLGEEPTRPAAIGLLAGLVAIWLIGNGAADSRATARGVGVGVWYGLAAGVGLALMLLALASADLDSGMWPLLSMQGVLVAVIATALILRSQPVVITPRALPGVAAIGVTSILGMLFFLYAARAGLVSIAAVISAMSPAVTVLLARLFMREVLSWSQVVGLVIAAMALVLIGTN